MNRALTAAAALVLGVARGLAGQDTPPPRAPVTVSPGFGADRFVAHDAPIDLTLSRALEPGEGQLAILVGAQDLTPLFRRRGSALVFGASGFSLPPGESEVKVYLVTGSAWNELGKFPLRVLTRAGFEKADLDPGLTLNNKGQLAEGHSGSAVASARPRYQDGTAAIGLQTSFVRNAWTVQTQTNTLGVTNEKERLRFATKAKDAPRVDLSDYLVRVEHPGVQLSAGHVSFGGNRHLINSFSSRGITTALARGPATLSLAAMNGSSIVGWDNIVGMESPDHRVAAATLALELLPKRPGGVHVDLSMLDGSLRPNTGYSQGGIVDAETSDGLGVQVTTSTQSQRFRASGGVTRSRFANGADAQLLGDTTVVRARAERKAARWAEATAGIVQNHKLLNAIGTTLNATYRHERVDPLYRSVTAYTQADVSRNVVELAGNVDALSFQVSGNRSRDNLARVASVLTTHTGVSAATLSVPLASLFRVKTRTSLWPSVTLSRQQTHQAGDSLPTNADFQASHVPDQVNVLYDAGAQWQAAKWRLGYRINRSLQDNRQTGREKSDLNARTNNVVVGLIPRPSFDAQLEANLERQENHELAQVNRIVRVGVSANWRATPSTTIDAALSRSTSKDEGAATDGTSSEARFGLSQGLNWFARTSGGQPGQLFVRISRQSTSLTRAGDAGLAPPTQKGAMWNASSGLSLRLF